LETLTGGLNDDELITELFERLLLANDTISSLTFTYAKGDDCPIIRLMQEAAPEVERLYEAAGKAGPSSKNPEDNWRQAVVREYENNKEQFLYFKEDFLPAIKNLTLPNPDQEKRDFMGKLFQLIIEDHGIKSHGYQHLMKIYLVIQNAPVTFLADQERLE
jgi:hypothetical protein